MEIKQNDATRNRPAGPRDIDAPFLFIDIPEMIGQLKSEKAWQTNDRNGITVFKTPGHTIVLSVLHQGASLEENKVKGFLTIQVIEGNIEVTVGDQKTSLTEKGLLCLHPEVTHNIAATSDAVILLHDHVG